MKPYILFFLVFLSCSNNQNKSVKVEKAENLQVRHSDIFLRYGWPFVKRMELLAIKYEVPLKDMIFLYELFLKHLDTLDALVGSYEINTINFDSLYGFVPIKDIPTFNKLDDLIQHIVTNTNFTRENAIDALYTLLPYLEVRIDG